MPPVDPAVVETHISLVVFAGDRAYKAKKPVRFGFLDFSTLALRQEACAREVELNRRIAPDVYLGVAELHGPGADEVEPVVVMRRMPAARRLATLVADRSQEVPDALRSVARTLVDFHARAERSATIDVLGTAEAFGRRWRTNRGELDRFVGPVLDPGDVTEADALVERFLAGRAALFDRRVLDGDVCDGHGDLQAADVFCLDDGPRILDTIEFDDELRYGDVTADVAFLAMDLERLGDPEAAAVFVAAYEEHAGRRLPAPLLHVHIAHRAQIRAKVACLLAEQEGLGTPAGEVAAGQARALFGLALDHLRRARVRLVLVGGLPGTGKSNLARGLGERFGWVVLRSDVVRKQQAGLDPTTRASTGMDDGIYAAGPTEATYDELLSEAGRLLAVGQSVVLDASWTATRHRTAARALAAAGDADVVELRCTVDAAVAAARIGRRAAKGTDASDADEAVAAALAMRADPWPEAVEVPTAAPKGEVLATVADRLVGRGPQGDGGFGRPSH
ncbi:MAG: AAA family ATPase [Acidimicrobiales bacterium]